MAKAKKPEGTIELQRLEEAILEVPIIGKTPLIPHKWSEKAKGMMPGHPDRDKVKADKGTRDPAKEAESCQYKLGEQYAVPATAFKAAMIGACRFFEKPTMVEAKSLVYVEGSGADQLVEFDYKDKELHEDTPRNSNGSADLRYRYYFTNWSAVLRILYVPKIISRESIIALVDAAGRGGIGDWRPSAPKSMTGTYGTWRVDDRGTIRDIDPKDVDKTSPKPKRKASKAI